MSYNPDNNPYIPGDPYSYDLKWMVEQLKTAISLYQPLSSEFQDLYDYVHDYFNNIDFADLVDQALHQMMIDGSLSALIEPLFADYEADIDGQINGIINTLNTRLNGQDNSISLLEARIDNMSTLAEGSTTGDAELIDGRVGAEGEVYPNIGDAIRGQIAPLNAQAFQFSDPYDWDLLGNASYPYGWRQGYYKNADGTLLTTTPAKTHYICTRTAFESSGDSLIVTPPTGYGVRIAEYSSNDVANYIQSYGSLAVDEPVRVNNTRGKWYNISIGEFIDTTAYFEDPDFLATIEAILLYGYKDYYDDKYQEVVHAMSPVHNARISMFEKIAVCGASWDCGYYYIDNTHYNDESLSWIANLARRSGAEYGCYARQSLYTKTWLSSSYGLSAMQADAAAGLYITTFGANDSEEGLVYLGTLSDITDYNDPALYGDTFYGNYGRIIEAIQAKAPKALIVMIMYFDENVHTATRRAYYEAMLEIASHYGLPAINWADDYWYTSPFLQNNLVHNHPTPVQLSGIADSFERLFSTSANQDYSYYKTYNP